MGKKSEYVKEKVDFLLPKMESLKGTLDKIALYGDRALSDRYGAVCKSVNDDILILRGIDQYGLSYRTRLVDSISKSLLSYMSDLGHFEKAAYSKKN